MSKDATKMYSTWFSFDPRGYWDFNRRRDWVPELYLGNGTMLLPDKDECCDEIPVPVEGVLDLELGSDMRSGSDTIPPPPPPATSGMGDREGLEEERCDICDAEREDGGKDASEVLRICSVAELALF